MTWNCCNFDKHDKLTQCCHTFTLALARLSCYRLDALPVAQPIASKHQTMHAYSHPCVTQS